MSPELEYAAYIVGGGIGALGAAWKLRSVFAADTRQIANDQNATKWQDAMFARVERLESKLDEKDKLLRAAEASLTECRVEKRGLEESNFNMTFQLVNAEKTINLKDDKINELAKELRKYLP
jgi:hypothetical protein